jgi:hypothetical protein
MALLPMKYFKALGIYRKHQTRICCLVLLVLGCFNADAQISAVNTIQNLSFGAFSQGASGGSITVLNTGITTTSGTVMTVNLGGNHLPAQAIFEIEAPRGTIISISNGPDALLKGSNGGTMSLQLGVSDPATPFNVTNPSGRTLINLGGKLTIGVPASNPPGTYNGTFYITFHNE